MRMFVTFMSVIPEIPVRNFKFYTHMLFCTMDVYVNNLDKILGILHLVAIFILFFSQYMSVTPQMLVFETLHFTHTCIYILCLYS